MERPEEVRESAPPPEAPESPVAVPVRRVALWPPGLRDLLTLIEVLNPRLPERSERSFESVRHQVYGLPIEVPAALFALPSEVLEGVRVEMAARLSQESPAAGPFPDRGWLQWERRSNAEAAVREREAEQSAARAAAVEERIRQRRAEFDRQEALLYRHLSPAQRRQYTRWGYFDLVGSSGRHYRIHKGVQGNIRQLWKRPGKRTIQVASLCSQPDGLSVPLTNLAQLLYLKHDEEALRKASVFSAYVAGFRRDDPPPPPPRSRPELGEEWR